MTTHCGGSESSDHDEMLSLPYFVSGKAGLS